MEWKPGDRALAKQYLKTGHAVHVTKNRSYIVCEVSVDEANGATYLKVLGDDNRGVDMRADLFERI